MKFSVNQQDLQKSLNYCQGVIEKRSTLPILSNILLDASNSRLTITATDLDLIFITEIKDIEIYEEGKTTTTSSILYDIIRKFSSGKKINFSFSSENKLELESEKLDSSSVEDKEDVGPPIISSFDIFKIIFSRNTAPHAILLSIFLIVLGFFSRSSRQFFVDMI